ncbi:MAG: hypothetical protein F6K19_42985 [Cyanothece sp. SIO1E1]|nr:hypothetical protein [Cyanothece sp. SIO1E1]
MKKTQILVYGKHPEILETVLRLINKNESWEGEGSIDEERVIELFHQNQYDLVLLGGGIPEDSEKKIRALFHHINPQLKVIQHYGGGSGLLKSEIEMALGFGANDRLQIMDNPFGA